MKKLLSILIVLFLVSNVNAVTSSLEWQDGSQELTINDGDDARFQVDVGSFDRPLTIDLRLVGENVDYVYEDAVVNDYLFGNFYLITKEHYKEAGDYTVILEATDGRNDVEIQTLGLEVLPVEDNVPANVAPVVSDILISEEDGLFTFEVIASDVDGEVSEYDTRVVVNNTEYSAFCEGNVCTFDSRDPTNDGFEFLNFDDSALVKSRAYDGSNWGEWFEKSFVVDNGQGSTEICDGLDNDLDGQIDEDGVCDEDNAPVIELSEDKVEVNEGEELVYYVEVTDEDNDLDRVVVNGIDAEYNEGVITWTPGYDVVEHGGLLNNVVRFITFGKLGVDPSVEFDVEVKAIDSMNNVDSENFTIKVNDVNRVPKLEVEDVEANVGDLIRLNVQTSDADRDEVKLSYSALFDSNGEWVAREGNYNVVVTGNDGYGGIVSELVNVKVLGETIEPSAPIISVSGENSIVEGEILSLTVIAEDVDGDLETLEATELPEGNFEISSEDGYRIEGVLTWRTEKRDRGSYDFEFVAIDEEGNADTEEVRVSVGVASKERRVIVHDLEVENLAINGYESARPGETVAVELTLDNNGNVKERSVTTRVIVPQWNIVEESRFNFDIEENKARNQVIWIDVPERAEKGQYLVGVLVSSDKVDVTEYRYLLVE